MPLLYFFHWSHGKAYRISKKIHGKKETTIFFLQIIENLKMKKQELSSS